VGDLVLVHGLPSSDLPKGQEALEAQHWQVFIVISYLLEVKASADLCSWQRDVFLLPTDGLLLKMLKVER
jgi:hypothetical protein